MQFTLRIFLVRFEEVFASIKWESFLNVFFCVCVSKEVLHILIQKHSSILFEHEFLDLKFFELKVQYAIRLYL